jgi:hypoxanthine phosphoribosyltransferase
MVVDDLVDTGETLQWAKYMLTATLLWNPKSSMKPKFFCIEKTDPRWIDFPWEQ